MGRYPDPTLLLAEDALVEWYDLAERLGVDDHGWAAAEKRGTSRILRWHVSERLGLPMRPFTVWRRKPGRRLDSEVRVIESRSGGQRILTFAEPLVRVEVDISSGGGTGVAMAFGPGPAEVALLLDAGSGGDGDTVRLHAPAVQRVIVVGADIGGFRVETLASAVNDEWEPIELVGLPARDGESAYQPDPAGLIGAETDGREAAIQRLQRAAPPIGWPSSTPSGRGTPEWKPVDPDPFVEELRSELLAGLLSAFDGRSPHELALHLRRETISGPRTSVGVAPQRSRVSLPVLATALLAAEVDLPVALALGLATGYSLRDRGEQSGFDLMVSAEYPFVPGLGDTAEVATVAPWPPLPDPMTGAPTGVSSRHSGPSAPSTVDRPWTTVVSTSWDRVRPSLTLDRPVAASYGNFDPLGSDPLVSLLVDRPSGGPRPLAITRLPQRPDRVGVADRGVELPEDGSGQSGHAVAVCDAFGVWSHWRETVTDLPATPLPVPVPTNAVATAVFAGSSVCSTKLSVDVIVDESTNSAPFVHVRGWLLPAAYAGAPPPPGLAPDVGVPPAGSIFVEARMRSTATGFVPEPLGSFVLEELPEADGNDPLPAVPGPRRRWRLTWPAVGVDYGGVPHWTMAVWARQSVLWAAPTPNGGPAVSSVSTPVPPVVTIIRPPVPPLGSAPDAEGRSHVSVPLPAAAGATKLIVWTLAETTLLPGALTAAAGLPAPALAARYSALRSAVGGGGATRRRFTRLLEVAPGTTAVDMALPRGSREIHLFAVTAVNAAHVESAWPANAEAMWAAVAPEVVAPSAPVVTTVIANTGDVTVTVNSRSRLPVAEMALHTTRSWEGARDAGSMGSPVAMGVPVLQADPSPTPSAPANPAGPGWQSTLVLPRARVEGWRGLHLRAVARPVGSAPELGLLGADSAPSEVVTVTVPPVGAPDLSALTASTWGTPPDGVVVRFDAGAPLAASPWGPHTLAARATAGAATLVQLSAVPLASIPPDASDPVASALPVLVRTASPAAGRLLFALWFRRPDSTVPMEVTVSLADPLGGVGIARVTVPPVTPASAPDVKILSAQLTSGAVIVDFVSAAPVDPATAGGWQIRVNAHGPPGIFFGPMSRTVNVVDIPLVGNPPPVIEPIEMVRFPGDTVPRSYRARIASPARRVRVEVLAPDGGSAVDQMAVSR